MDDDAETSAPGAGAHRSGFVALVGRPNAGKSTLLNRLLGEKISIVSDKPQTTRFAIRGVLSRPDAQIVFVDTPGLHKPRTAFGDRMNTVARDTVRDVDVTVLLIDARQPIGTGDRLIASELDSSTLVAVNKIDRTAPGTVLDQLATAGQWDFAEYFPISARTGEGVDVLVDAIVDRLEPGPAFYPPEMSSDLPEAVRVAELVREQLLRATREELPHSIHTRVTEWEGSRIRCEILVERESQKPMVIGKGGSVLKEAGTAARSQLPEGTYLELHVRVEPRWQRRPEIFERIGEDPLDL